MTKPTEIDRLGEEEGGIPRNDIDTSLSREIFDTSNKLRAASNKRQQSLAIKRYNNSLESSHGRIDRIVVASRYSAILDTREHENHAR